MSDADEPPQQDGGADDELSRVHLSLTRITQTVIADFWRRLDDLIAAVRREVEARTDRTKPHSVVAAGRGLRSPQRRAIELAIEDQIEHQNVALLDALGPDTTVAPADQRLPMNIDLAAMTVDHLIGASDPKGRMDKVLAGLGERFPDGREYATAYLVWRVGLDAPSAVASAIYQGAVAEFEALLAELLRLVSLVDPARLNAVAFDETAYQAEPQTYMHDLIWSHTDFVRKEMRRDGHKTWMAMVSSVFGADSSTLVPSTEALAEIFQRRNVLAHRGAVADQTYVNATGRTDAIGSVLTPAIDTVCDAVALLDALGTQLAACWLHAIRTKWSIDRTIAWHALMRQLDAEQWTNARAIALGLCADLDWGDERDAYRVNTWMARLLSGDDDSESIRKEIRAWEVPEGSELAIAKACLLDDETSAVTALDRFTARGGNVSAIADWPLAKQMAKRSKRFRAALKKRSPHRPIR